MRKLAYFFVFCCFLIFFPPVVAQSNTKGIAQAESVSLLIYTGDARYQDSAAFLSKNLRHTAIKFGEFAQFKSAFQNFLGHINEKTLLTIYYSGYAIAEGGENYLVSSDQHVKPPRLPEARHRLMLVSDVLAPVLEKNPLGLFMFYDVLPWKSDAPAFVKQDIPKVALFYPTETGDFIDLSILGESIVSLNVADWEKKHELNLGLDVHNQLVDSGFPYCLKPYPGYGCESFAVSCSLPAVISDVVEPFAVVKLTVNSQCRKNQIIKVKLDGYRYAARVAASGEAVFYLFPTQVESVATIIFEDGEQLHHTFTVNDVERVERVILSWQGASQLDLHVLQPRVRVNASGDIWRQTACKDSVRIDRKQRFNCVRGLGGQSVNMQVYTRLIALKKSASTRKVITFRVDYFNRGDIAKPPYCGTGQLATANYTIQHISGKRQRKMRQMGFESISCGNKVRDRYYEVSEKIRIR